ncbi:MAG: hypothetical protein IPG45_31590 [Deltaproteobacteria bacterium]|jgi:hypothetical protein|nr:hypothetical protein [Deltaproteobacteria bacterium]
MNRHPGFITYVDADAQTEQVASVEGLADALCFAPNERGDLVPVVRVVASRQADERHILEYGPQGEVLRSTIQRRSGP